MDLLKDLLIASGSPCRKKTGKTANLPCISYFTSVSLSVLSVSVTMELKYDFDPNPHKIIPNHLY